ncbi:MAG: VWA domain-containing protein [Gammaproteobacteria bacterium]|nr:VWA domain-containing protein [Gammaproteobacteria bacterium]
MIEQFHFLRPAWLLAFIPLSLVLWYGYKHRSASRSWQAVVDAALLPHLINGESQGRKSWLWLALVLAALLAIIALAGPVWERLPQPIFRQQSALVIGLDLSRSMDAGDIKPSRLTRARHKIADILALRKEGQTALVTYAADAFVVTPLTEDAATINALLPSLSTQIMPSQGSHVEKAITLAFTLFDNAGLNNGDILLVTDGFNDLELAAIEQVLQENSARRVSVLGVGTSDGGPIPMSSGGFLKDDDGAIVISRLNGDDMEKVANSGGGEFQLISNNDDDIDRLLSAMQTNPFEDDAVQSDLQADVWRELGPWLVLMLLPLVALVFRRGRIFILPLLLIPISPESHALSWDELWKNVDQRASEAFEQGEHQSAAELFDQPEWKASSHYRTGDYEKALQSWEGIDSERGHYNRGNTLAKLGRLEEAVEAYDKTLELNSGHEDAIYNRKVTEDLLKQQQQQRDKQQNEQQQENQEEGQQQGESEQSSSQGRDQQNQADQQQSEETQKEPSGSQQQSDDQNPHNEPEQLPSDPQQMQAELEEQMSEQAAEQWLRKIPDDPGGLLRRKFLYQYRQRGDNSKAQNPW